MTDPSAEPDSNLTPNQDGVERVEANTALGTGLGIGAFGVASATLLGAVCPICVVAAPALIGYGLLKRVRIVRAERKAAAEDEPVGLQPRGQQT